MSTQAPRSLLRGMSRALRLRCPRCGGSRIMEGWFKMRDRCSSCDLHTARGEADYFLGAMTCNLIGAELICAVAVAVAVVITWPTPPWNLVMYGGAAIAVAAPFLFYPLSKTLWLAVDLTFRPRDEELQAAD